MANGYALNYEAGTDPTFIQRVQGSILKAAYLVSIEANTVVDHDHRVQLSIAIVSSADSLTWATRFALAVAVSLDVGAPPTATEAITDAQIDTTVATVWNAFAGVHY